MLDSFIHEGDMIVAKVIIPEINKYNFTSAEVSDTSYPLTSLIIKSNYIT